MTIYLPSIHTNGQPPVRPAQVYGPEGLGVGMPWQNAEADPGWYDTALELLMPAWWYNWKCDQIGEYGYYPMLWRMRRDQYYDEAITKARANPRMFWLMGNEPEEEEQSNTPYTEAASTMRKWEQDTAVLWACPGVILGSKGMRWLEGYLNAGGPVPTVWHVHLYTRTATEWWLRLRDFSDWMEKKRVIRPVIVSETALDIRDADEQIPLLAAIGNALSMRRVQAVSWFSAEYANHSWSNLLDGSDVTTLGHNYLGML